MPVRGRPFETSCKISTVLVQRLCHFPPICPTLFLTVSRFPFGEPLAHTVCHLLKCEYLHPAMVYAVISTSTSQTLHSNETECQVLAFVMLLCGGVTLLFEYILDLDLTLQLRGTQYSI